MSKHSQREKSFFEQGKQDFLKGRGFRWKSHPYLPAYKSGWAAGQKSLISGLPEKAQKAINKALNPWWKRVLRWAGFHV